MPRKLWPFGSQNCTFRALPRYDVPTILRHYRDRASGLSWWSRVHHHKSRLTHNVVYNPTASLWVPITRYILFRMVQVMTSTVSPSCPEPPSSLPAPHQSHSDKIHHNKLGLDTEQCLCPAWPCCKKVNVPPSGPHLALSGHHGHPQQSLGLSVCQESSGEGGCSPLNSGIHDLSTTRCCSKLTLPLLQMRECRN